MKSKPKVNLRNIQRIVPLAKLAGFRSLDDIHKYLPAKAAGLTIESFEGKGDQRETIKLRTAIVRFFSNTPAMGAISKHFNIMEIFDLLDKRVREHPNYDEYKSDKGLTTFEGWDGNSYGLQAAGYGHTNPLSHLDQMLKMGPNGGAHKRGPEPIPANVALSASNKLIARLKNAIGVVQPAHLVLCTEDSVSGGVPFSSLRRKSAGMPAAADSSKPASKENHLVDTVRKARSILRQGTRSLNMYPGVVYKRYDRKAPIQAFRKTDQPFSSPNPRSAEDQRTFDFLSLEAKDRSIVAMPFASQTNEGTVFRPVQVAYQRGPDSFYDMRTPYHTANTGEDIVNWVRADNVSDVRRGVIGVDESGWDQSVNPQAHYYGSFRVLKALLPKTAKIGWIECPEFIVFDARTKAQLEAIAPGNTTILNVKVRIPKANGEVTHEFMDVEAGMEEVDMDSYLRRIFAVTAGSPILVGDVLVKGYRYIMETLEDGKVQLGWGQRSGNWSTFWANSTMMDWKAYVYEDMCKDAQCRMEFKQLYGYELPRLLRIVKRLIRGDDGIYAFEVDLDFAKKIDADKGLIARLFADLISYTGGEANADKQETSGVLGTTGVGFAQIWFSDMNPRGVVSLGRAAGIKQAWREEDEATGIDPLTGNDYRELIGDMGNFARLTNLWGGFGKELHPLRDVALSLWQDLDVPERGASRRLLPPADEATRIALDRVFLSRMLRRGQAPPGSENLLGLWNTDFGPDAERRFADNPKLRGNWSPLQFYDDARSSWRPQVDK